MIIRVIGDGAVVNADGAGGEPPGGTTDRNDELRCLCGSLMARIVAQGVELRCRRCRRTVIVPLAQAQEDADETLAWRRR